MSISRRKFGLCFSVNKKTLNILNFKRQKSLYSSNVSSTMHWPLQTKKIMNNVFSIHKKWFLVLKHSIVTIIKKHFTTDQKLVRFWIHNCSKAIVSTRTCFIFFTNIIIIHNENEQQQKYTCLLVPFFLDILSFSIFLREKFHFINWLKEQVFFKDRIKLKKYFHPFFILFVFIFHLLSH